MRYYLFCALLLLCSCSEQKAPNDILRSCYRLSPLTRQKHPVQAGEWRAVYTEVQEPLKAYLNRNPPQVTVNRCRLYVVQLGVFDVKGKQILEETKAYLHAFYQIPVTELPPVAITSFPTTDTRQNTFGLQLKTPVILDSLLPSLMPDSAFALIAFSLHDLYPSDDWNFVFGQAGLNTCVGVWSLARLGDYNHSDSLYNLCRQRTLNVAVHETGHIFGIKHCVRNECCMNGSLSLGESDRQPAWLCRECLAKVCLNRNMYPAAHINGLLAFHRDVTKDQEQIRYYKQALQLLKE